MEHEQESREAHLVALLEGLGHAGAAQFVLEMLTASALGGGSFPVDFLDVLLRLNRSQADDAQLLAQLNALVSRHTRLRRACVVAGWTSRLLRELVREPQPHLLSLCTTLASFSVGVRDVRALVCLAHHDDPALRPASWTLALTMLQSAAARSFGPSEYYDLSGAASGVLLPVFPKLPSGGVSWAGWVRVEMFGHSAEPVLLALCDETDQGIVCKFSSNFLVLQAQSTGKKAACFSATFPFKPGQWYCVAVAFEYHFVGADQASLYVDGQLRGQFAIPYPKNAGPLTRASVGCYKTDRRNHNTLVGQVSSFFLFDGVLPGAAARALYEAGPDWSKVPRDGRSLMVAHKMAVPLLAAYNPRAADDALCLEVSTGSRKLHALKLEGTAEVRQSDFSEAVVCVGGPQVLLPLFAQLDLAVAEGGDEASRSVSDPGDAATVLELVAAALRHPLAAQAMLARHGFHMMGHVFRCVSPLVWDARSFGALEALADSLEASEELHRSFFINIYLNFSIWIYAPVVVQRHVLGAVAKQVSGNRAPYFRQMITVQRIIDGLRLYYWTEASAASFARGDVLQHAFTGETLGERPRGKDLLSLRQMLLLVAKALMCGDPSLDEIQALLVHVTLAPDAPDESTDVVQLLLAFLNEPKCRASVARHLLANGLGPLVSLVERKSESMCVWAIKLVGKVLQVSAEERDAAGLTENLAGHLSLLKTHVQGRRLTRDLYYALVEVALECVDTAAITNPMRAGEAQVLRNATAWSAILELLARLDDRPGARHRALSDLLALLTAGGATGRSNRRLMTLERGWEARVLAVLAMSSGSSDESVALDVASVLVQHCLVEGDAASVARLFATLELFGDGGHFKDAKRTTRTVCERVAEQLAREHGAVGQACREAQVLAGFIRWLDLYEGTSPPSSLQAAAALGVLCETALVVATSGNAAASPFLFSLVIRTSLATVASGVRVLDSANEREHRMSEIEAVLLAGETTVPQPMIDALAKYKAEKTRAWRGEEQLCSSLFSAAGRRLVAVAPLFAARHPQKETAAILISSAARLVDTLKVLSLLQTQVAKDSLMSALGAMAEALAQLGALPPGSIFLNWHSQNAEAVVAARLAEQDQLSRAADARLREQQDRKQEAARSAMAAAQIEADTVQTAIAVFGGRWDGVKQRELERRRELAMAIKQKKGLLESEWKNLLAELSDDRGPWSVGTKEGHVHHWMVHGSESNSEAWIRVLRKKNKAFNAHEGCARGAGQQQPAAAAAVIAPVAIAPLFIRPDGDADDNEDEVDGEEPGVAAEEGTAGKEAGVRSCTLVSWGRSKSGTLELSRSHMLFGSKGWPLETVVNVRGMRHLSRKVALEVEFVGGKTRFIAFETERDAQLVYRAIVAAKPRLLHSLHSSALLRRRRPPSAASWLGASKATERWMQGAMSNFEYLMQLNRAAGRSYADLAQYPVMPWVVADWKSSHLDLSNPAVYRDLSCPVGALNPARRQQLRDRYGEGSPPFHHGSHFSNSGTILFWLLRQEPFATLHLELQGGRFDHPDRLFSSLPEAWNGVWNNAQDCKEMVPELFYDASFLVNSNCFVFGQTQGGAEVDDVVLPPWAKSAEDFVALHRAALESEYVSQNLHRWIDLVFGAASRGPRAVEALNVFYWVTYPENIDWKRVEDGQARKALVAQIENFGQCPDLLFKSPHPPRRPRPNLVAAPGGGGGGSVAVVQVAAVKLPPAAVSVLSEGRLAIVYVGGKYAQCVMSNNVWQPDRLLGTPKERPELVARINAGDGRRGRLVVSESGKDAVAFVCGAWDCSWRAVSLSSGSVASTPDLHLDEVQCLAKAGNTLVTGSRDTTILIWDLALLGKRLPLRGCGHEAAVTSVALCEDSHSCCSGSADGTVILRETHSGKFLHSYIVGEPVDKLCVAPNGDVFAATPSRVLLLNVARLPEQRALFDLVEPLVDMCTRGPWFLACFKFRIFVVRAGAMVRDVQLKDEVFAVCFSGPATVIAAHGNGTVSVIEIGA